MSSKKSLLSKLKKDMSKSKAKISADVSDTVSVTERRNSFLKEIKIMMEENKTLQDIRDRVRIHISFYIEDKDFSKLLDLEQKDFERFLENYDEAVNVMTQLQVFYSDVSAKTQKSEIEILKDQLRSIEFPVDKNVLYAMNPFVFESLSFTPSYNVVLFPALIHELLSDESLTTPVLMRKNVHKFMFEHRFDYVIRYLENDSYNDNEKQFIVSDTIRTEYENIRSIQLYLHIMNIIDENITPFQTKLLSVLLRFLPEKEYVLSTKNFLEIILEIVINKPSDKQLEKYFGNKKKLDHFKEKYLPLLQTREEYTRLIQNRCRQEFEQPYVFKHADRVKWQTYLEILKKHISTSSLSSVEVDIYNSLNKHESEILDKIIILLQDDEKVFKSQIQILLAQYISLQPSKKQKDLEKLKHISSFQKLKELLIEIRENGYIDILNTLSSTMPKKNVAKIPLEKDDQEMLYKSRFDIPNFDHIVIEPIDDVSMYISKKEMSSNKFFVPNDLFYQHMVYHNIVKSQKGNVFTMDKKKMKVAYATLTNEYIYQDEKLYNQGLIFVKTQKAMDSTTNPLSFYSYFTSCPILNHQSSLMTILRQKTSSRLSTMFIKQFPSHVDTGSIVEDSIYKYSETLDEYATCTSILISIVESEHAKTSKQMFLNRSINISEIGQLLKEPMDVIFQVLYPEIFAVNDEKSLRMFFDHHRHGTKRTIILDTYFTQHPMRRIPYIPVGRYLGGDIDKIEFVKEIPMIPEDLSEKYLQEPTEEEESVLPIVTKELEEEIIEEELDPLADFIDTAFDELDNL